jgi:transposase
MEALRLDAWPLYLPALGWDETLYSWCGAVHRRSSAASAIATSEQLFGSRHAALLHDFPAHLDALVHRTEGTLGEARALALRHTILGYFLAFRGPADAEAILHRIRVASFPALKMRLGIPASRVGGYHPLRSCSECTREDMSLIGRPLWHVEHQLPSVFVCRRHFRPLVQHRHRISPVHQRIWLLPTDTSSSERLETYVASDRALGALLRLAEFSSQAFLLEPGHAEGKRLTNAYRAWAVRAGGMTRFGYLRHHRLLDALRDTLELLRETLTRLGPASFSLNLDALLSSLARTRPKPAHPLKHLLIITSMFERWESFLDYLVPSADEAACNKPREDARANTRRDVADNKAAFLSYVDQRLSIRAAALSAGVSVATGVRWAKRSGIVFPSRAKLLSPAVLSRLKRDLGAGQERRRAAERAGVSKATVDRLLSTDHALRDRWQAARHETARSRSRLAILNAVRRSPQLRTSEIRKANPAAWTWLYRHDKLWLEAALPALWTGPNSRGWIR